MKSDIINLMIEEKLNSVLTGVSGEYFVAAELSKRGYLASITLRNTKGVDVLCSNSDASKTVGIQVKTNKGTKRSWILNQKAEDYFADSLYYVFVCLNNNQKHPDYFIVPSKVVASYCKSGHSNWLNTPGKNGQQHKDTLMRKFDDVKEEWNLLLAN
jgi:hypothetical protein